MKVKFLQNLGSVDAAAISNLCGEKIDHTKCTQDAVVDLPQKAFDLLSKKYPALMTTDIHAVPAAAAVQAVPPTGPAVQAATEDFKRLDTEHETKGHEGKPKK